MLQDRSQTGDMLDFYLHNAACSMQKMKQKVCIFNFNAALISHLCALWCCFTMKTFPHMHTCIILQSANPQAPPALSQGVISGNYLVSQRKA